jgi:glycosyltransferase involved in cell wall biosynthesis
VPLSELKICLVSPVPPPYGGIGNWTLLMHRFVTRCPDVRFIQVNTVHRWRAFLDIATWELVIGGGLKLVRDYVNYLLGLLKRPDIVHLTTSGQLGVFRDLSICATARIIGVPIAYHIRFGRVPEIAAANTLEWQMMAHSMRMSGVVVAVDPATAEVVGTLTDVRVEYVPNAIDVSELPVPVVSGSNRRTVLFLGSVIPGKGIEELVRAWSELAPKGWDLLIVGPAKAAYQEDLLRRYRPDNLRFLGELEHDEAMQLMAQCELFVLPSHTEGFPNVLLEAMAMGKAIIATSVGAIPDILSDGCGLVIEPKDLEGLKATLLKLMLDERLRHHYGARARKKVQQEYSLEAVFARYVDIWRSLLPRRVKHPQ